MNKQQQAMVLQVVNSYFDSRDGMQDAVNTVLDFVNANYEAGKLPADYSELKDQVLMFSKDLDISKVNAMIEANLKIMGKAVDDSNFDDFFKEEFKNKLKLVRAQGVNDTKIDAARLTFATVISLAIGGLGGILDYYDYFYYNSGRRLPEKSELLAIIITLAFVGVIGYIAISSKKTDYNELEILEGEKLSKAFKENILSLAEKINLMNDIEHGRKLGAAPE